MTGRDATLERELAAVEDADRAVLLCSAEGTVLAASEGCGVVFECDTDVVVDEPLTALAAGGHFDAVLPETYDEVVATLRGDDNGSSSTDQTSFRVGVYPGLSDERLQYEVRVTAVRNESGLVATRWTLVAMGTRERYEETLEALHRATRDLVGAEDELAVYDRIGAAANDILGMPGTGVRKYDPDRDVLRHIAFGNPDTRIDGRPPYDVDDSPHGRAFRRGEVVVEEITGDDAYDREVFSHVMYVPIDEYGVLSLGRVSSPFADTDRRFAEILVENGATAIQEVRQRQQLERQRRDLEQYETIVETVPDPVYATDEEGWVTFANEAFEEYFGYDRSSLDGVHATDLATDAYATTLEGWLEGVVADDGTADRLSVEVDARGHDDRRRQFEASIAPLPHDDGFGGAAGVFRDVTDRKRRQEVLAVMNRALRHNLRTTASTITVYANILGDQVPPEHREYVESIESATSWLVKLGDTLRTLQTVLTESRGEDVAIDALLDRAVDRFRDDHPAVTFDAVTAVDGRLPGGPALRFALDNVLENAVVHNDAAEPAVTVSVEPADSEGWVDVAVADNGPGIPETERAVVLGEAEITQLQHGSGIGLWVTRWIVQAFDGEIDLANNEPRGTVVTLTLPLLDTSDR